MRVLGITLFFWIAACQTLLYGQTDLIGSAVTLSNHPRILLQKGEEQALQQAIQVDTSLLAVHQLILSQCDSLLRIRRSALQALRVERIQHHQVREALRRLFVLAYGWRLSGRQPYFTRAKFELWQLLILTNWNPEQIDNLAEITTGVALAYDWLYEGLSSQERSFAQKTLIEKGLTAGLAPRDSTWLIPTDYQRQVLNTGLVYGALAIYETQPVLARSILYRSIESANELMSLYEPNGAYPYGYSSWNDATSFTALLISALQKEFKTDFGLLNHPGFTKTSDYGIHMRTPLGNCFNYGETSLDASLQPAQFWLARQGGNQRAGWRERNWLGASLNRIGNGEAFLPAILIWSYDQIGSALTQAPSKVWVGRGKTPVASLRSSWDDSTALFIGLKAGTPSLPGAHMDVGSFVVEAQGVRWAIDLGEQDTDSLQQAGVGMREVSQNAPRWLVFRHSPMSHNTLVVNYGLQSVRGYAPIISHATQDSFLNAISDLTSLYEDALISAKRGVAIKDNNSLLVQDELETGSRETKVRWAFVTAADVDVIGPNQVVLRQSGKQLHVQVDSDLPLTMRTWSTGPRYEYDSANPGTMLVGFEAVIPAQTKHSWQIRFRPGTSPDQSFTPVIPLTEWPHN